MYLLEWKSGADNGRVLASHGMCVPLTMDNTDRSGAWTADYPESRVVAAAMSEAWLAFARDGDPNHKGLAHWPAYVADTRSTMRFDVESRASDDPHGEAALWRDLPPSPLLLPF